MDGCCQSTSFTGVTDIHVLFHPSLETTHHRHRNHGGSGGWCPFILLQLYYAELHILKPLPIEPPFIQTSSYASAH